MLVSISVSGETKICLSFPMCNDGETKICLSFPMCNDHLNESMRKPNGKEGSDIKFRKSMKLFRCNFIQWVQIILKFKELYFDWIWSSGKVRVFY